MKENLIEYIVEYGRYDFAERPFCEVDALVFCQAVYPKIDSFVPADDFVFWDKILGDENREEIFADRLLGENYRTFLKVLTESRRFAGVQPGYFQEKISEVMQMQFAAVTFRMPDDSYFIAYRGTDEKLIGWKEDLNISYEGVIPSEEAALKYLTYLSGELAIDNSKSIIVGGHSKGGALAVYAGIKAPDNIRRKVTTIYSFDGVGLGKAFRRTKEFKEGRRKICKIIPDESIVGILFEDIDDCRVVESRAHGIRQHGFMNWRIKEGGFCYCDGLKPVAALLAERIQNWLEAMSREEKKTVSEILYDAVVACRPDDIYGMADNLPDKVKVLIDELKGLDDKEKLALKNTVLKLIRQ